ncbi:MAG: phosphoenolpyruvate--protein phosphotransferase [Pseudonocardiaceae bacterium]
MIGIVVVSHSRALARAAVALAQEMVPGRPVRIEVAAGLDDTTFGTDAMQILQAITAADQGAGVLVLMDLGSAVLSAELALDLLDDQARERVLLCPAPLVEGLIVAAVAAAGGAGREEMAAEAAGALAGKTAHLAPTPVPPRRSADGAAGTGELVGAFTVTNPHGLHARPASRVVQAVRTLDARVRLRNLTVNSPWVPASSLSKVATLGVLRGHEVEVRVAGNQAREALDQVLALAARNFDQVVDATIRAATNSHTGTTRAPLAASPGIGIGPAWSLRPGQVEVTGADGDDPATQWRRLREAIAAVRCDVQRVRARAGREVGDADAAIFDAHLLLLEDAELLSDVRLAVEAGQAAAPAWSASVARIAAELAALPDSYLQARAADVRAVGDQVRRALLGVSSGTAGGAAGVLVAADLTPAEAAGLDPIRVTAVVLAFSSPTAHSVILLRARGIPAVVGAGLTVLDITDGTLLAADGTRGEVVIDPPPAVLKAFQARAAELARRHHQALAPAAAPARTRDGVTVHVGANVGSVDDAHAAAASGADVAGLVRTEYLFLSRDQAPDVEEQEAAYRGIAAALDGRRITLRTLDVGADKPLGYLRMPVEANPFLGVRGIRLALAHPQLLTDQLLAIVRVAHDLPVSLMFPMISTLDELIRARRLLDDAIGLAGRGRPADLRVGIMVEVPATALKAHIFAPYVDFLSIGTNDLSQYALAAERGNDAVADISDPFDPGVLRLVQAVCRGAGERALVAVCGELAADERACALLVGFGVRELSVAPRAIPEIKQAVRRVDSSDATTLAVAVLDADSADAVRGLLAGWAATADGR